MAMIYGCLLKLSYPSRVLGGWGGGGGAGGPSVCMPRDVRWVETQNLRAEGGVQQYSVMSLHACQQLCMILGCWGIDYDFNPANVYRCWVHYPPGNPNDPQMTSAQNVVHYRLVRSNGCC